MLAVHQCHVVKDSASGKDCALPVSAQIAQEEFLSMSRQCRHDRNRRLQQSLYDVTVDVVASGYASTVSVTFVFELVTLKKLISLVAQV